MAKILYLDWPSGKTDKPEERLSKQGHEVDYRIMQTKEQETALFRQLDVGDFDVVVLANLVEAQKYQDNPGTIRPLEFAKKLAGSRTPMVVYEDAVDEVFKMGLKSTVRGQSANHLTFVSRQPSPEVALGKRVVLIGKDALGEAVDEVLRAKAGVHAR